MLLTTRLGQIAASEGAYWTGDRAVLGHAEFRAEPQVAAIHPDVLVRRRDGPGESCRVQRK